MARLNSVFNLDVSVVSKIFDSQIYTFSGTRDVPTYSIKGDQFMGQEALQTYEGKPWILFEKNKVVYDFTKSQVVPLDNVNVNVNVQQSGYYYVANGLIIPGSITPRGRVLNYSAWVSWETFSFRYSWIGYGQDN